MTSLLAITKLTIKSAIRSYIFQLLLLILVVSIFLIPTTISGDGTAWGFIQISLKYSFSFVGFILSMSTIWLSCSIFSRDVESYQIHMVVTKPVSKVKIWIGKWLGIVIIHALLLLIACSTVYVLIIWEFKNKSFGKEEKDRIEKEVLVGRRVFRPKIPDIDELARKELKRKIDEAKESGLDTRQLTNDPSAAMRELRKMVIARLSEVKAGPQFTKTWEYTGLNPELDSTVFVRYRPYLGKISTKDQAEAKGQWHLRLMLIPKSEDGPLAKKSENAPKQQIRWVPRGAYPESIMCGIFNELSFMPKIRERGDTGDVVANAISPEGDASVAFTNWNMNRKPVFFQLADGPNLLVKVADFWENYSRAVFVLLIKLLFLAGLSCAAASFLSMPTAIFSVVAYLLFGFFASYLVGSHEEFLELGGTFKEIGFFDLFGTYVSKVLLWGIIPIQSFEVSGSISSGELIEWLRIGRLFLQFFILRGVPLFLLGVFLYWRRELGLIVRK